MSRVWSAVPTATRRPCRDRASRAGLSTGVTVPSAAIWDSVARRVAPEPAIGCTVARTFPSPRGSRSVKCSKPGATSGSSSETSQRAVPSRSCAVTMAPDVVRTRSPAKTGGASVGRVARGAPSGVSRVVRASLSSRLRTAHPVGVGYSSPVVVNRSSPVCRFTAVLVQTGAGPASPSSATAGPASPSSATAGGEPLGTRMSMPGATSSSPTSLASPRNRSRDHRRSPVAASRPVELPGGR